MLVLKKLADKADAICKRVWDGSIIGTTDFRIGLSENPEHFGCYGKELKFTECDMASGEFERLIDRMARGAVNLVLRSVRESGVCLVVLNRGNPAPRCTMAFTDQPGVYSATMLVEFGTYPVAAHTK